MEYNKPPLGARPYYIMAINRIDELSKAIYDYSQETDKTDCIKKWASEIILQCELIEAMRKVEKENERLKC